MLKKGRKLAAHKGMGLSPQSMWHPTHTEGHMYLNELHIEGYKGFRNFFPFSCERV